jgi:hypothetical protein
VVVDAVEARSRLPAFGSASGRSNSKPCLRAGSGKKNEKKKNRKEKGRLIGPRSWAELEIWAARRKTKGGLGRFRPDPKIWFRFVYYFSELWFELNSDRV